MKYVPVNSFEFEDRRVYVYKATARKKESLLFRPARASFVVSFELQKARSTCWDSVLQHAVDCF